MVMRKLTFCLYSLWQTATLARALTLKDTKKCTYHMLMFLHLKKKYILSFHIKYIM